MEGTTEGGESALRGRALSLIFLFVTAVSLLIVLETAFESDVQHIDAGELAARKDAARAFLAADYMFVVLYAVLTPIALLRFGTALGDGRPPGWMMAGAACLAAGGLFDLTENTLLFAASGSGSQGAVDTAHAVAIPKIVLVAAGGLVTVVAVVRAAQVLRAGES